MARPRIDHTNQRFGRITLLAWSHTSASGQTFWLGRCDCGVIKPFDVGQLVAGKSASCGCARPKAKPQRPRAPTHGMYGTPTYRSWQNMKQRCLNPKHHKYRLYGARGITVCDRWLHFPNFLADMGPRPPDTTIDRIDPDGHYEPGNCRWASPALQRQNQR